MPSCSKCGKEVYAGASYCPSCSASLRIDKNFPRKKIAEARRNKVGALVSGIVGLAIIFIGTFVGLITEKRIEWEPGPTPREIIYHPYVDIAIILLILGVIIAMLSGISGAYYRYQRRKLGKQLESLK